MNILIAFEQSGIVRDAFRSRGWDAYSCDIRANDSEYHIRMDARVLMRRPWDMIIAHPPCTYLAASGARWERDPYYVESAIQLFWECLESNAPKVAVENPAIQWKKYNLPRPSFCVQPWEFGHPVTKQTCFWVRGLPPLAPTNIVKPRGGQTYGGRDRARSRARTYEGIAEAMASQWG